MKESLRPSIEALEALKRFITEFQERKEKEYESNGK